MDVENMLKNFNSLANQFSSNKTELNLQQLGKHLDMMIGVTGSNFEISVFDPRKLWVADCITTVMDLLNDPQVPMLIHQKLINFMQNLASDPFLLNILEAIFNISYTLSSFVCSSLLENDPLFLQCLQLLQLTSYYQTNVIEDIHNELLQFLIRQVFHPDIPFLLPSLGLLANLCRHSPVICNNIKNMDNLKQFYKSLVSLISSHADQGVTVQALSVLTSLTVNEEIRERVYKAQNIYQTFELLFHILINGSSEHCCLAIDLFLDLQHFPKIQHYLSRYQHLQMCFESTLDLLADYSVPATTGKLFELLASFFATDNLKKILLEQILKRETETFEKQPLKIALKWITDREVTITSPVLHNALNFFGEIIKGIVPPFPPADLGGQVDEFLSWVYDTKLEFDSDDLTAKWHCLKIAKIFEILTSLSAEPLYKKKIIEVIDIEHCKSLIEQKFNSANLHQTPYIGSVLDWSLSGIDVFLHLMNFLVVMSDEFRGLKSFVHSVLQDEKFIPIFVTGLVSRSAERSFLVLCLLRAGMQLDCFPLRCFATLIAKNCSTEGKNHFSEQNLSSIQVKLPNKGLPQSPMQRKRLLDSNVQALIERMEKGLEIKDVKASEIMDMYEHKIEHFRIKEKHVQDLLEAKALALQQADRLLAQYRCRWAQSDAEALKLRNLLQESERRSEVAKEQTTVALVKQQQMQQELENTLTEIQTLEQELEERNEACGDLIERLDASEKSCNSFKQENAAILELNTMLQRHQETYKQKQAQLNAEINELELEKKNLIKHLKEKENKLKEMNKQFHKLEKMLEIKSKEAEDLAKSLSEQHEEISALEERNKNFQEEISSLEGVCRQHEVKLKDKEEKYKLCIEELEHHRQITAMIQNISSGRIDILNKEK